MDVEAAFLVSCNDFTHDKHIEKQQFRYLTAGFLLNELRWKHVMYPGEKVWNTQCSFRFIEAKWDT